MHKKGVLDLATHTTELCCFTRRIFPLENKVLPSTHRANSGTRPYREVTEADMRVELRVSKL